MRCRYWQAEVQDPNRIRVPNERKTQAVTPVFFNARMIGLQCLLFVVNLLDLAILFDMSIWT